MAKRLTPKQIARAVAQMKSRRRARRAHPDLEGMLARMLDECDREVVRNYEREVKFCETRNWRFDFAWPQMMVAVEVQGGDLSGGRHVRPKGFVEDCTKFTAAAILGWRVLPIAGSTLKKHPHLVVDWILRALTYA